MGLFKFVGDAIGSVADVISAPARLVEEKVAAPIANITSNIPVIGTLTKAVDSAAKLDLPVLISNRTSDRPGASTKEILNQSVDVGKGAAVAAATYLSGGTYGLLAGTATDSVLKGGKLKNVIGSAASQYVGSEYGQGYGDLISGLTQDAPQTQDSGPLDYSNILQSPINAGSASAASTKKISSSQMLPIIIGAAGLGLAYFYFKRK